ncbi:hypothetical protein ACWEPA_33270 [Streptomyces filamentosus]
MSEWVSALIGAGSAVAGGIATGWFTRNAGHRQAAAAEAAGQEQAAALISTVQATLDEQRRARAVEHRRQIYVQFLEVAEELLLSVPTSGRHESFVSLAPRLATARGAIEIEGPREVAQAAAAYMNHLVARLEIDGVSRPQASDEVSSLRAAYLGAVRRALDEA